MGKAIIIPDVNFSDFNLGTVTLVNNVPLTSLSIIGPDSFIAVNPASYSVSYSPANTTQRGVAWSIVDGASYASIDSNGNITVLDGAPADFDLTIRATSIENASIYAEKEVGVSSYPDYSTLTAYIELNGAGYYATDLQIASNHKVRAIFTFATRAKAYTVLGSRTSSSADDNSTIIESAQPSSSILVKASFAGKSHLWETQFTAGTKYICECGASSASISPELGTITEGTYTFTSPINFAVGAMNVNGAMSRYHKGKIYGIYIYDENDNVIHCLIPQPDTTLKDYITGTAYTLNGNGTYGTD